MKTTFILIACVVAFFAATYAAAQNCASTFTTISFSCQGPDGSGGLCHGNVNVHLPMGGADSFAYECGSISCCGQLFTTCSVGGPCGEKIIKKAGIKNQVDYLAATYDVLVADCKGQYVPYSPLVHRAAEQRVGVLLEDRVLR